MARRLSPARRLWILPATGGLLYAVIAAVELQAGTGPEISSSRLWIRIVVLGLIALLPFGLVGLYSKSDLIPATELPQVFRSTVVIIMLWTVITVLGLFAAGGFREPVRAWLWPLGLGVLVGYCVGLVLSGREARVVHRTRQLVQEREARRHLEDTQVQADRLISLLRHNLLNELSIIIGKAAILEDTLAETPPELTDIHARSVSLTEMTKLVALLLRADTDEQATRPINLRTILTSAYHNLEEDPPTEPPTTRDTHLYVEANDRLSTAIELLVDHLVSTSQVPPENIACRILRRDSEVELRLGALPLGTPVECHRVDDMVDALPYVGVQVAATIIASFNGELTSPTEGPGTTFVVTLPLAADPDTNPNPDPRTGLNAWNQAKEAI